MVYSSLVLYTLIETPEFSARRVRLLSDAEFRVIQSRLLAEPDVGNVIPGTGGVRKLRVAMRGKGTRGGGRVIYLLRRQSGRIYLLTCYAKGEQEDISPNQRKMLRLVVDQLP